MLRLNRSFDSASTSNSRWVVFRRNRMSSHVSPNGDLALWKGVAIRLADDKRKAKRKALSGWRRLCISSIELAKPAQVVLLAAFAYTDAVAAPEDGMSRPPNGVWRTRLAVVRSAAGLWARRQLGGRGGDWAGLRRTFPGTVIGAPSLTRCVDSSAVRMPRPNRGRPPNAVSR